MPIIAFYRKLVVKNTFKIDGLVDSNQNSSTKPLKAISN